MLIWCLRNQASASHVQRKRSVTEETKQLPSLGIGVKINIAKISSLAWLNRIAWEVIKMHQLGFVHQVTPGSCALLVKLAMGGKALRYVQNATLNHLRLQNWLLFKLSTCY